MTKPRRSSRWILCYAIAAAGCSRGEASFPTAESWPDSPRRADGVAVDPASSASLAQRNGRTGEVGAVPLSPPAPVALAVRAVVAFFDALPHEDLATLNTVLSERAGWVNPAVSRNAAPALGVFVDRFRRLDYEKLEGVALVREAELEVTAYDEFDPPLPGRPPRPPEMRPGDVLVRARVVTPRIGGDRLLGDELAFVLRPDHGRHRIFLVFEEFQLP